jgi:glycosyltransferase involved in cell wall biosynthesis
MMEGGYRTDPSFDHPAPLISVVTVCYNAAHTLEQCIHSVSDQDCKSIEHIVIDGKSSDRTLDILQAHDKKIAYWLSEQDKGIYNAMNKALQHIKGQWVIFLGADDELLPGFSLMPSYLKDDHTLYYSRVLYDQVPVGREIDGYFLAKNNICHQSIFYPKAVFEKYRFDEKYRLYADHYLNMQCWSDPDFAWQYCDVLTARFALDGASAQQQDPAFAADKVRLIKKHFGQAAYWRYRFKELKSAIKR